MEVNVGAAGGGEDGGEPDEPPPHADRASVITDGNTHPPRVKFISEFLVFESRGLPIKNA
jgi:hypothetical protein